MNNSIYRITLDVLRSDAQVQLTARVGDTSRTIQAVLTERGLPYEVESTQRCEFATLLPSGQILKNPCVVEDGKILYSFTQTTTALPGVLACELRVLGAGGELLVSPKFSIAVYDTIYTQGDAVLQEGASLATVKSARPGYGQVFLWSDGNPEQSSRLGRFVSADTATNAAMVALADGSKALLGVTAAEPGFAANAGREKYESGGVLAAAYCYVTMLGFAPVTDRGRCSVNGRCSADTDGTAIPCENGGFLVAERVDADTVTVLVLPHGEVWTGMEDMTEQVLTQEQYSALSARLEEME